MKNTVRYSRGSAGIMSIIIMTVLGLLGAAFVAVSSTEVSISSNHRDGVAAQYLAEAGALWSYVKLKTDATYRTDTNSVNGVTSPDVTKNSGSTAGTYSVKASWDSSSSPSIRKVIATGTVGSAKRQVVILVDLGSGGGTGTLPVDVANIFKNNSYASGSNMVVENKANVCGNISSNGQINVGNNATIGGTTTANSNLVIPEITATAYQGGTKINTNLIVNGSYTLNGGVYYIAGDLTLNNNSQLNGNGTVYVTGNINIQNNAEVPGKVFLISANSINISNGAVLSNALLYANQNITLSQTATVNGAAIARNGNVNAQQNSTITCSSALTDFFLGGTGVVEITKWDNK